MAKSTKYRALPSDSPQHFHILLFVFYVETVGFKDESWKWSTSLDVTGRPNGTSHGAGLLVLLLCICITWS